MFFGGGDPFEHFSNMHGGGGGRGGGRGGPVDNNEYYELLGKFLDFQKFYRICRVYEVNNAHMIIVGVAKDADEGEIKKAYKKLALKNHPDKGGDIEKVPKPNMW
jgi:DnaJ family protein A protein 2